MVKLSAIFCTRAARPVARAYIEQGQRLRLHRHPTVAARPRTGAGHPRLGHPGARPQDSWTRTPDHRAGIAGPCIRAAASGLPNLPAWHGCARPPQSRALPGRPGYWRKSRKHVMEESCFASKACRKDGLQFRTPGPRLSWGGRGW
jgi:hypothetical protein